MNNNKIIQIVQRVILVVSWLVYGRLNYLHCFKAAFLTVYSFITKANIVCNYTHNVKYLNATTEKLLCFVLFYTQYTILLLHNYIVINSALWLFHSSHSGVNFDGDCWKMIKRAKYDMTLSKFTIRSACWTMHLSQVLLHNSVLVIFN